jgi:hypothetical protein
MYRDNRLPLDLRALVAAEKPPAMPASQVRRVPIGVVSERARANSIGPRVPVWPGYAKPIGGGTEAGGMVRTQRRQSLPSISEQAVGGKERKIESDGEIGGTVQSRIRMCSSGD